MGIRKIKLIGKRYVSIPDSLITITDEDLEIYFQENISKYQIQEEVRSLDWVMFEVKPSLEDRVETTRQVNELYAEFPTERKNFTVMVTSLGCPKKCTFCEAGGTQYNARKPETVIAEMEECYNKYGIREIDIFDYFLPQLLIDHFLTLLSQQLSPRLLIKMN